ncbi:MAG: c-type cytochrome [Chitinophagaceae bacterium]|nr:c-type cytochrome [Chitinophagaceae bacterium]
MRITILFILSIATSTFLFIACNSNDKTDKNGDDITKTRALEGEELVKRGQYLVTVGGCNDCHSPKNMTQHGPVIDSSRMLSGHPSNSPIPEVNPNVLKPGNWMTMSPDLTAWAGPWGMSFTANLTPDSATGIGAWSEDVFTKALRTGKHLGQENGRPILPPMPWEDFAKMTDEDLRAVFAYLRSLPPVSNRVPAPLAPNEVKTK